MQEPPNIPLEVTCHDLEMKPCRFLLVCWTSGHSVRLGLQAPTVYQFHVIAILQLPPPMSIAIPVEEAMAAEAVDVAMLIVPWSMDILVEVAMSIVAEWSGRGT